jgi:hypothetical protein
MRFARRVFLVAGVYGILVLVPQYFLEQRLSRDYPPAVTHPEFYYGFVGVALAWQVLFLAISRDPVRLRPAMPAAVLEKAAFAIAVPFLYASGRVASIVLIPASIDAVLGTLFLICYFRTAGPAVQGNNRGGADFAPA